MGEGTDIFFHSPPISLRQSVSLNLRPLILIRASMTSIHVHFVSSILLPEFLIYANICIMLSVQRH